MGAWWYVRPRLHTALRFHLRREAWQARAAAAASAAAAPAAAATEAGVWGYGPEDESSSVAAGDAGLAASKADLVVRYVGRPPAAATATASFKIHVQETEDIINAALHN
jgi:hypothetical protein